MTTEKRLISVGDELYIIGKYSFSPAENPKVIEVQVSHSLHRRYYACPLAGYGWFSFTQSDLDRTVFFNREDAERTLRRCLNASD